MVSPAPHGHELWPVLKVEGLRIELKSGADVVDDINLEVASGEVVGLVGESGSGKTTLASALLAHVRPGARISAGAVWLDGVDLLRLTPADLRSVRGKAISYVAQDPATALNPLRRVGTQLQEMLRVHAPQLGREARQQQLQDLLKDVGLPADEPFLRRFVHQLSGGQQQRVLLALAFASRPRLIVLDEPTTALDVTTQARILDTVRRLCRDYGVAAIYVSHDLAVVKSIVDRVVVLYAGRIVEEARRDDLFDNPLHPYSRGLLAAIPEVSRRRALQPIVGQAPAPGTRPAGCAFSPRCPRRSAGCEQEAPGLNVSSGRAVACLYPYPIGVSRRDDDQPEGSLPVVASDAQPLLQVHNLTASYTGRQVLFDVSFSLAEGECLALVGESGSGKTTLARALAGLGEHAEGRLLYKGQSLSLLSLQREPLLRRQIQYVFQNPYRALNPRHSVGRILRRTLRHFFPELDDAALDQRSREALQRVALQEELLDSFPRDLSGGERQRVAIARALVCQPKLLICDEITSALDVSVQATILALLQSLQAQGLAILFVTHDLGVVRTVADRVIVLRYGQMVEHGLVDSVLDEPRQGYTRLLVKDSPTLG